MCHFHPFSPIFQFAIWCYILTRRQLAIPSGTETRRGLHVPCLPRNATSTEGYDVPAGTVKAIDVPWIHGAEEYHGFHWMSHITHIYIYYIIWYGTYIQRYVNIQMFQPIPFILLLLLWFCFKDKTFEYVWESVGYIQYDAHESKEKIYDMWRPKS